MLGRILEKFTEERQRRMICWEVPRRAAEMAANTPKKFTWMLGKTLLESPKTVKGVAYFQVSACLAKISGALLGMAPPSNSPPGVFDIVEYSPRAQ